MGKMHEILAAEGTVRERALDSLKQIKKALADRKLFSGQIKTYQPKDEDGHVFPPENIRLQLSVEALFELMVTEYGPHIDLQLQKEMTNSVSKSDLLLGGNPFTLSAPALLNLEARLVELKAAYERVPVNDNSIPWKFDGSNNWYASEPKVTDKFKKLERWEIVAPATKEHPAQVKQVTEDVVVGQWTTTLLSGMMTPKEKHALLQRIDDLLVAVKKALRNANDVEAQKVNLGVQLMKYINTGVWE